MDPKKTVPGLANARWRVQVEQQGHEALKKKMLQLSSSTNKSINKRKKRGLKFSVHFVVLKIYGYILKEILRRQRHNL